MTQSVNNINFNIYIDKLLDDDSFANISTNLENKDIATDSKDLGSAFAIMGFELQHSLLDTEAKSSIKLTVRSSIAMMFKDAQTTQLALFLKDLIGRRVVVSISYTVQDTSNSSSVSSSYSRNVYTGFISTHPDSVNIKGGNTFTLECMTILGQLNFISSNSNWEDATKTYGNAFTTANSNTLSLHYLNKLITTGTLVKDNPIYFNGDAKPIPDPIWAFIMPQKSKLDIVKEILTPYARVFYQAENGNIYIRPLFYDDNADSAYNVDVGELHSQVMQVMGYNNASQTPNRVDVTFGASLPVQLFNAPNNILSNEIFASAPLISKTNTMVTGQSIGGLDYTKVYSSSYRLYNSGLFQMPIMKTLAIDNGMLLNKEGILNPLMKLYPSTSFGVSQIRQSHKPQYNTIPLLYSQIYLAQLNTANYTAIIVYNYEHVIQAENPLGKIISIYGLNSIDYPQMIVTDTTLKLGEFAENGGTTFRVQTAPLLSITGVWHSKGNGNY